MSEIKPVYQIDVAKTGAWFECTKEEFDIVKKGGLELADFRILYPAEAYEALKEKLERLNGLYHSEVSKHQLDYNALKAENEQLRQESANYENATRIVSDWNTQTSLVNMKLREENEAIIKQSQTIERRGRLFMHRQ